MKYCIINNIDVIILQGICLSELEIKFIEFDVGFLNIEVGNFCEEFGLKLLLFLQNVYSCLNEIDIKQIIVEFDISVIKILIGYLGNNLIIMSVNINIDNIVFINLELN